MEPAALSEGQDEYGGWGAIGVFGGGLCLPGPGGRKGREGLGGDVRDRRRRPTESRRGIVGGPRAGFLDEAGEGPAVVIHPPGRVTGRVQPGRVADPPGREQHSHEVRGDPGVLGRKREGLAEMSVGRLVVGSKGGADAEPVHDPRLGGGAPGRSARALENLPGLRGLALCERHPSRGEKRFRSQRRPIASPFGGPQEVGPGGGELAAVECRVPEPEHRLRSVGIALREGAVEAAGDVGLPGGEGGGGHRKAVPEQLPGVRCIAFRRQAGAGGEHGNARGGRGGAPSACERMQGLSNQLRVVHHGARQGNVFVFFALDCKYMLNFKSQMGARAPN